MNVAVCAVQQSEAIVWIAATDELVDDFLRLRGQWTVRFFKSRFVGLEKMLAMVDQDSP